MITIKVKVFHRRFKGDTSFHYETHDIRKDCLKWWQEHSGRGDFDLIEWW